MAFLPLQLPNELAGVPPAVLKQFLSQFSKLLVCQLAPEISEQQIQACVNDLLGNVGASEVKPVDVRLEFKHVCKFTGCSLEECQLCRNNPNKVCDDADCFDHQYWVRDDGKGGQLIKAKCGADVSLQLIDKATNAPVHLSDVKLKLYVINGQQLASSGPSEPPMGLYLSDDGHPLFAAACTTPEDDKGVPIEQVQDERLGAVGQIPELQFLDKNSKFKVGGRTFKCFKLMARAVRREPGGAEVVLAQVESESFKVTTKKGYDGCRKAEYLYAHDPITDKTFANLGETTISNLKANFDGVETVEDLMQLVQACRMAPDMEARLRETLNMARDAEKWRNLTRMLSEKVVWDDSMARIFVIPTASRPLGLLYRANKAQVDFSNPAGVILSQPTATGQLRVVRLTDRLQLAAGRHIEALRGLAAAYWKFMRHPGWALAPDSPLWEEAPAAQVAEAFTEVLGQGDPNALADLHLAALQQAQMAAITAAGTPLMRAPTPASSAISPQPLLNAAALQGSVGMGGLGGLDAGLTPGGAWVTQTDLAASAAAAAAVGGGGAMMSLSRGGTAASPVLGQLPRGMSGVSYDGSAAESMERAAAAGGGFGRVGLPNMQPTLPLAGISRPTAGRPTITTGTQLGGTAPAPGTMAGLSLPSTLPLHQAFGGQTGQMMPTAGSGGTSPFAISLPTMQNAASMQGAPSAAPGQLPSLQQQQQQVVLLQQMGPANSGLAGQSLSAGRPSSACSGLSGGAMDSTQQQQQQQPQQVVMLGQMQQPSKNTQLLQQAIIEGWPAPQVKAVLDQMTDDELRQLVAHAPGTAAGVLARAGGDDLQGFGAMDGVMAQQVMPAQQQQQQQPVMIQQQQQAVMVKQQQQEPQSPMPQQQQQPAFVQQQQQQQAGMMAGSLAAGSPVMSGGLQQGGGSEGQQGAIAQTFEVNMTVGPHPADDNTASGQQQGAGEAAGGTATTAAAALAALFADTAGGGGGSARGSFDVSLTADQMNAAALLNLSVDSFADPIQWGDILENLRQLSSSSGGNGGAVAGAGGNNPGGSFSTEWIPELLFRLESESKEKEAAAAAAAAGGGGGSAAPAASGGGTSAPAASIAAAAAAAVAMAAAGGDNDADEKAAGRKAKRERSKTGQAPTAEQLAQLQALFAGDPGQLRSLSKAENHFGSFNRHFPVARCSSQKQEVHQGAQVSNPWNPGQPMSASGVPALSPPGSASLPARPAITTHAPGSAAAQGNTSRIISAGTGNPCPTTEAGAAAVATVTGLDPLQTVPEAGDQHSSELLNMLETLDEQGVALGGSSAGGSADAMYLNSSTLPEAGRTGNRAVLNSPFLAQVGNSADEAAAMVHAPTTQRDSSGKAGWISSLFRSGSSWSSKSNSLHANSSGQINTVGSQTSKDLTGKNGGNGCS